MKEEPAEIAAWIGLDWADEKHVVCLQALGNQKREIGAVEQRPEKLAEWVAGLRTRFKGRPVVIALEQSRGPVLYALKSYDFLKLVPIPPRSLSQFRKVFRTSGAQDDADDAELLLELVQKHGDRFRVWEADDELTRSLGLLTEHRRKLVDERTRLRNRLTSLLKCYFPQALQWAGGLETRQACAFLRRWPTLEAVQKARPSQLRRFYQKHGCRRPAVIEQRIQQIRKAQPLTQDEALIEPLRLAIETMVGQLEVLHCALSRYDQQIAQRLRAHEDRFLWEPLAGAGPALAPRLLAGFGSNRERFEGAEELLQFSGVAPVTERSGKKCWVHWRLGCPKFLRQTFHEFAAQTIRQSPWAKAFYELKREAGMSHHAAVRMLAYKWIRILFRCWKDRVPYSEPIYLQSLARKNPNLFQRIQQQASLKETA
jgi:transposase